jgi:hypothetical protein
MKAVLKPCKFVAMLSLLLLSSCATVHRTLPADVTMNKEAGRGGFLVVTVQLEDGQSF